MSGPLHVRWLGRVAYADALALQRALHRGSADHLLMLEHPATYTLGVRADARHLLIDPSSLGATVFNADRGGDITYHGPGQLVGYPVMTVPVRGGGGGGGGGGMADTAAYVHGIEAVIIEVLADLGLPDATRRPRHAGVWLDVAGPGMRKIAAVGVRIDRRRSMHGFSLNVTREVDRGFAGIVACGITDASITSLEAEGIVVTMQQVVDAVARRGVQRWADADADATRADHAWRVVPSDLAAFTRESHQPDDDTHPAPARPSRGRQPVRMLGRLAEAGVDPSTAVAARERKPDWMVVKADMGPEYRRLKQTLRSLELVTVCEEAGCPNIFDCWNDGTATFMVLGERCTRACGFCLVDTSKPLAPDPDEPRKVAEAVEKLALQHAVITMVARDDLADGGARHVADTIRAVRDRNPGTRVEVLVSDHQGDPAALEVLFDARPDVFNHNTETVLRLQRAVRPSASYARSLSVLGRAKAAGLTTKSGLIAGMGETIRELELTLVDLRSVGVDIITIGQYLRPTERHLPVDRWVTPDEFDHLRTYGEALGFAHVESSPLTRSSYHARQGADAAALTGPTISAPVRVSLGSTRR